MGYSEDYDYMLDPEEDEVVPYEEIVSETGRAILFKFQVRQSNGRAKLEEKWLPRSQVTVDEVNKEVLVPAWLYKREWGNG